MWVPLNLIALGAGACVLGNIKSCLVLSVWQVMRHGSLPLPARREADLAVSARSEGSGSFAGAVTAAAAAAEDSSLLDSVAVQQRAGAAQAGPISGSGDSAASAQQHAEKRQPSDAGHPGAVAGRLGCYFCNDVVAPLDSTAGRALDQQVLHNLSSCPATTLLC